MVYIIRLQHLLVFHLSIPTHEPCMCVLYLFVFSECLVYVCLVMTYRNVIIIFKATLSYYRVLLLMLHLVFTLLVSVV